jgi:uncharacterized iron-regulated membrane protein
MVMVTGFGYAFLGAALLTGIGIIFAALLKQQRHRQARVVAATVNQRNLTPSAETLYNDATTNRSPPT